MFFLSVAMLGSMHAVQINHLRHHRFCLQHQDIEAMSAHLPFWGAILVGPVFPFRLHWKALEVAPSTQRRWIHAELAANVLWIALVFGVLDCLWLKYHVVAMMVGQCSTAFFAVWTVHHGCAEEGPSARSIRNRLKGFLTYNMFYHFEHHLFPAVPTCRLPIIAERLDKAMPEWSTKSVF